MTAVLLGLAIGFAIGFVLVFILAASSVASDLAKISQTLTRIADSLEPRAFLEPKR